LKNGLRKELARKAFHMLSLVYLGFFTVFGRDTTLIALGIWLGLVWTLELARLNLPAFNRFLLGVFQGIHRPAEEKRISGVVWTSLGCWATVLLFGDSELLVRAGILCVALGDAAAALVGKRFGRHPFRSGERMKSIEGSLGCFAASFAGCLIAGLPLGASAAAAVCAAVVEAAPVPIDDNLWLPLVSAAVAAIFLTTL